MGWGAHAKVQWEVFKNPQVTERVCQLWIPAGHTLWSPRPCGSAPGNLLCLILSLHTQTGSKDSRGEEAGVRGWHSWLCH